MDFLLRLFVFKLLTVSVTSHIRLADRCKVSQCEFKVTAEHAAQIAFIQQLGISEEDCIRRLTAIQVPEISAVYCPELQFCGLDLDPKSSKDMKFSEKSCLVFSKSLGTCDEVGKLIVESEINECKSSDLVCGNGAGLCINHKNQGYDCTCYSGFDRIVEKSGKIVCKDVDECTTVTNPCPGPFDNCVNVPGSYQCPCESTGFHRLTATSDCSDVDECEIPSACPDERMICTNLLGSYTCQCQPGYESDEHNQQCFDINECLPDDPCTNVLEHCVNEDGSYSCECNPGYVKNTVVGLCENEDECSRMPSPCNDPNGYCKDQVGSYTCECRSGYELDANSNCWDVDECQSDPCEHDEAHCINDEGSYSCECNSGFYEYDYYESSSGGDDIVCVDINECHWLHSACPNPGEFCQNEAGSYTCQCVDGFTKNAATDSCVDIDECSVSPGSVCPGSHICVNKPGFYYCQCPSGYIMNRVTENCIDRNTCDSSCDGFYLIVNDFLVCGSDYYTTPGKVVRQSCSGTCSCADGFMAATFEGSVFCLTAFFLTNNDVNVFPVCNAPCCSSYCDWIQPEDGYASSVKDGYYDKFGPWNAMDGDLDRDNYGQFSCFRSNSQSHSYPYIWFNLGSYMMVSAVSILNYNYDNRNYYLDYLEVWTCWSYGISCTYCGMFLTTHGDWNHLFCQNVVRGSCLLLQPKYDYNIRICEILVHYVK